MRISLIYNISLFQVIASAKEITYKELRDRYLPSKQPGVIQGAEVSFDRDLSILEEERFISREGDIIRYIGR